MFERQNKTLFHIKYMEKIQGSSFTKRISYLSGAVLLIVLSICLTFAQNVGRPSANANVNNTGSNNLINPGKGVGQIKIGDTLEQVLKRYPKLSSENYYPASGDCQVAELILSSSLSAYLIRNRVVQIKLSWGINGATPATAEGISPGSDAAAVKKSFPNANQAYTKIDGAAASTGYELPIFWVDRQAGIVFEFVTDSKKGRVVDQIHIFLLNTKIRFAGPCDPDEDLRELAPFATKVPDKLIRDYEGQSN